MKYLLSAALLLAFCLNGFAQERKIVKPGQEIQGCFSKEESYLYPDFIDGTVLMKNKQVVSARMNYNIIYGQMMFLKNSKDTLAIAEPQNIEIIIFPSDTFYYASGYHQLLAAGFGKFLTRKQFLKIHEVRKGGAFGTASSLSATTTMSSYYGDSRTNKLTVNQEVVVSKQSEFYIADSKNRYRILNRITINKLYPKHKLQIDNFIDQEKIDLEKEQDVIKLFGFLMRCI
jgi:hypothetical protein